MLKVAKNITELIGETPLVRINKLIKKDYAKVYAKLEWFNIGGSIKDRMAKYLIEFAEEMGKLTPPPSPKRLRSPSPLAKGEGRRPRDKTILEATSGNTGIALAMIAAVKGYKIVLVMPESVSIERRKIIKAYGAELILSPGRKGTGGAVEMKQELLKRDPQKYVDINQFEDQANVVAHYRTTGKEIIEQTFGKVNMVVVGIGTAGTGVGISMKVKEYNSNIKIIGVMPKLGVSIQGLRNIKEPYPTKLFRKESFDELIEITKEELPKTFEIAREIAKKEGLLIGISSGAIMYVALRKAKEIGRNKTIVAVLPDSGWKYLSTKLFDG